MENLKLVAKRARESVLRMAYEAKDSHIGCALSSVDILVALYFSVLKVDPNDPGNPARDRFVLSKGHAASALYAVMCERGFFPQEALAGFSKDGSTIANHVSNELPGVETVGGSGGHGLPLGAGMALAALMDEADSRTFVLMGDGELQEGSVWEAAMFAASRKLTNLTLIVDRNEFQTWSRVEEVVALEPLKQKFQAFGWVAEEISGHDTNELQETLHQRYSRPNVVIASTTKGCGVSFMEGSGEWHNGVMTAEQYEAALKEVRSA